MRYLGNKKAIIENIVDFFSEHGLLNRNLTFFDAFAGTGTVADAVKNQFNLIINDSLEWSSIYTKGRIYGSKVTFDKLVFDPFEFINSNTNVKHGFFYKTYSTAETERMYFSEYNAGRIDYIRNLIESWNSQNKLNEGEYEFLLASLIESISKVANTAGVYGAFLKHWDSRALKEIEMIPVPFTKTNANNAEFYHSKIENIISEIKTDVLYLDPPYTQNQYGTQYHIFETLIKNDNPKVSKITGSRPTGPMRSDWSKNFHAHILFDKVLSQTTAKYVILSYNNDGIMSKEFIEASMKRYGYADTFEIKKIPYKKYQNFKSQNRKEHFEYLFFVEMKKKDLVRYESPLNYIGSKAKMIDTLLENFPKNYSVVYDVFGGGFNVGINLKGKKIIYNDINFKVSELIEMFSNIDTYQLIMTMKRTIKKYGLEPGISDSYKEARQAYNELSEENKDPKLLYTIILYGFQQQIRFNSHLEFNNPVGLRWFNDKILEKLVSFSRHIKELDVSFSSKSFDELEIPAGSDILLYLDPPYRLTLGSYNDGKRGFKGWTESIEGNLFDFMISRHKLGNKIVLSYVITNGLESNETLLNWLNVHPEFHLVHVDGVNGWSGKIRDEILVMNYEQ
ncbi:MAG: DNA adenine methylase [Leuconostoc pseudomesenteroides]|uniref:DNA adenine methylase n=1 Tax=Leuconostoc pseudomesenteroides TaxID=33968 RepID=UPI0039ECE480